MNPSSLNFLSNHLKQKEFDWIGNSALYDLEKIAVFCSSRCSGKGILAAKNRFQSLANPNNAFIGGFQTDVEKMVLSLLLRNGHNVILFPARSISKIRLTGKIKEAVAKEQLALASAFCSNIKRADRRHAIQRNNYVASIASKIIIIDCHPESNLSNQVQEWCSQGKNVDFLVPPK